MHEYSQDALTYVREFGRPDLFITFTCNPAWTEIRELLTNGQEVSHRHDLIARVFEQKQLKFREAFEKLHIFGEVQGWVNTIEWQKRGLPHSHNLVWLKTKIHAAQIDSVISAELPDPEVDPGLFAIVTKNMIHGPCGRYNLQSPCMKDGKCTKKFPRQLLNETQTGIDGYPLYRRRAETDGGFTTKVKLHGGVEMVVDNRWVVPYSPALSKMFNAHINVEYCSSVKSIKYICKYVNKGSDMAAFSVVDPRENDEVHNFEYGRYLSSNESFWRIFSYAIHYRSVPVTHLQVHLENGQRVYFTEQNAAEAAANPRDSTLTAFFKLCAVDELARTLLYVDVPKHFTWNKSKKCWSRRKIGTALGRVYVVSPKNKECYFLRLLLHKVRGPRSYVELKTVENHVCETFREACQMLGLLEGDHHWDECLAEAKEISVPSQIRDLFAIIISTCHPSNPAELWMKYRETLSEDILARVRRENPDLEVDYSDEIFNEALIMIEDKCESMNNCTLQQLGLPSPVRNHAAVLHSDYLRETNYNGQELTAFVAENRPLLNADQERAFGVIMSAVENNNGSMIFLQAPGGTGKTFLTNLILAEIRSNGGIAVAVASSGIAATLMEGGRTAHSALKLPLDIARLENPTCNISRNSGVEGLKFSGIVSLLFGMSVQWLIINPLKLLIPLSKTLEKITN